MTDITASSPLGLAPATVRQRLDAALKGRHAQEFRFRVYGVTAITIAAAALVVLLWTIVSAGYSAFIQTQIEIEVTFDPQVVSPSGSRDPAELAKANYRQLLIQGLRDRFPEAAENRALRRQLDEMVSNFAHERLLQLVLADPSIIGTKQKVRVVAADEIDMLHKGVIKAEWPEEQRPVKDAQIGWYKTMVADGSLFAPFNTDFLTEKGSREPELASVAGAMIGSLYTMAITLLLALPIGVAAAVYLEEFAPKNRFTDLIEVNIANLAAVPSIVFGLLGLAVFLGAFGLPRSTPLVGGMVLALMALPVVIISARAALKAVPPSIREAALGMGASRMQAVSHHVLPLAMPGILTGTILAMAHSLGETAPLLMIGMNSFITEIPQDPFADPAAVLPVQIYIWADMPERAFVEKTSAAIMVLLMFLVIMNGTAIYLRKKFERRW